MWNICGYLKLPWLDGEPVFSLETRAHLQDMMFYTLWNVAVWLKLSRQTYILSQWIPQLLNWEVIQFRTVSIYHHWEPSQRETQTTMFLSQLLLVNLQSFSNTLWILYAMKSPSRSPIWVKIYTPLQVHHHLQNCMRGYVHTCHSQNVGTQIHFLEEWHSHKLKYFTV